MGFKDNATPAATESGQRSATVVQRVAHSANQQKDGGSIPARSLLFAANAAADADSLVRRFHYSNRPPGQPQLIGSWHLPDGLLGLPGTCIAACYFCNPPTRWSEEVIELSRLVRDESHKPSLTQLIRLTIAKLPKHFDLAVSFADSTQGHVGYVYQAANWNYGGKRERAMDGVVIEGKFYPGRTCNSTWGTRSPEKLSAILRVPVEPHYDEGKHIYWHAMRRSGIEKAQRLGLSKLPYPKADTQLTARS